MKTLLMGLLLLLAAPALTQDDEGILLSSDSTVWDIKLESFPWDDLTQLSLIYENHQDIHHINSVQITDKKSEWINFNSKVYLVRGQIFCEKAVFNFLATQANPSPLGEILMTFEWNDKIAVTRFLEKAVSADGSTAAMIGKKTLMQYVGQEDAEVFLVYSP